MQDTLNSIEEIANIFKKKFWIIVAITIITTASGIYSASKLKSSYQATITIFIGKDNNLLKLYSEDEIKQYSSFIEIFNEIIKVDNFLSPNLKKYGIDKDSSEVVNGLSFTENTNIPLYTIIYSSSSNEDIDIILKAVVKTIDEKIDDIIPGTVVTKINSPTVVTIKPQKIRVIALRFILGIISSILIILVIEYLDDRIKNIKQLEKVIPVPVIGNIPTEEKRRNKEENNVNRRLYAPLDISRGL